MIENPMLMGNHHDSSARMQDMVQLAEGNGIAYGTFKEGMRRGLSPKEAATRPVRKGKKQTS